MYYDGAWRSWRGYPLGFAEVKGEPVKWTGKSKRRKLRERGRSGMLASHLFSVKPGRCCCPGHDYVAKDKGTARRRSESQWQAEWGTELTEYDSMFNVGDIVYYTENGTWDTGVVLDVDDYEIEVRWDADDTSGTYYDDQLTKI